MMRFGAAVAAWLAALVFYVSIEMSLVEAVQGSVDPTRPTESSDVLGAVCFAAMIGMAVGGAVYAFILRLNRRPRSRKDYLIAAAVTFAALFDSWSGWLSWNGSQFVNADGSQQFGNGFAVHVFGLASAFVVVRFLLPKAYKPKPESASSSSPPPQTLTPPLKALITMLAQLAKADGVIKAEEIEVVSRFLRQEVNLSGENLRAAQTFFQQAKNSTTLFSAHAAEYARAKANNANTLTSVLLLLVEIASADNDISAPEMALLEQAADAFGLKALLKRVLSSGGRGNGDSDRSTGTGQQRPGSGGGDAPEAILGVRPGATQEEIRKAYIEKVQQYHPDKVAHLGPKLRDFAEAEIKRLNAAYEILKGRA